MLCNGVEAAADVLFKMWLHSVGYMGLATQCTRTHKN